MDPIVFLDIDGVLNTQKGLVYWDKTRGEWTGSDNRELFDPEAVEYLNKLIESTKAKVVVISTWRGHLTMKEMAACFKERNVECEIIGYTPQTRKKRGEEILMWMEKNGRPERFVIIDDDANWDITEFFPKWTVDTDGMYGFAEKKMYKKALSILKTNRHDPTEATAGKLFS